MVDEALAELDDAITEEETGESKTGRRKTDKSGLQDLASKMIEEGTLFGFDDDKELENILLKILENYLKLILQEREAKIREGYSKRVF